MSAAQRPFDPACIFCRIVAGDAPASVVYLDEAVTAFMDIQPINPGHLLIVPNAHATYLAELDEGVGWHMFGVAQRLAAAVRRSGLRCEGINLFLADGPPEQVVLHVHLHVIPRYTGDGFDFVFPEHYGQKPPEDLEAAAASIRRALGQA
ncbi:MAG: HIT family protein [Armatimonadetes bacterium]|nr:HIT family protein [Armatimonadota bacterium]